MNSNLILVESARRNDRFAFTENLSYPILNNFGQGSIKQRAPSNLEVRSFASTTEKPNNPSVALRFEEPASGYSAIFDGKIPGHSVTNSGSEWDSALTIFCDQREFECHALWRGEPGSVYAGRCPPPISNPSFPRATSHDPAH